MFEFIIEKPPPTPSKTPDGEPVAPGAPVEPVNPEPVKVGTGTKHFSLLFHFMVNNKTKFARVPNNFTKIAFLE